MKKKSKAVRVGLIVFFLVVAFFSTAHVIDWAIESYQSSKTQKQLQQLYNQGSSQTGEPVVGESTSSPSDQQPSGELAILPEYTALYEVNSDIVGWLNIGNGVFSTPVVQRDNEN